MMSLAAMIVLGVLVVALAITIFFIVKAIQGANDEQKVSEAQRHLDVGHWYVLDKSQRRRDRVRSQLPVSDPNAPGADETFVWVTGLVRARLWFVQLPVLLVIPLVIYLWVKAADLYAHPYVVNGSGLVSGSLKLNNVGGFLLSLAGLLLLLTASGYALVAYLKWNGEYLVLSTYRLLRVRIYPSWAYWMKGKNATIELSDITLAGNERSMFGKACGYAAIKLDTPGDADNIPFNNVPFIPNGHLRAQEIDGLQRVALPPRQHSETDRIISGLNHIVDKLDEKFPTPNPIDRSTHWQD